MSDMTAKESDLGSTENTITRWISVFVLEGEHEIKVRERQGGLSCLQVDSLVITKRPECLGSHPVLILGMFRSAERGLTKLSPTYIVGYDS